LNAKLLKFRMYYIFGKLKKKETCFS